MAKLLFVVCLISFSLLGLANPSSAYIKDANDLIEGMRAYEQIEAGVKDVGYYAPGVYCGYIVAVYDCNERAFCGNEKATGGQLFAIVTKYLNEHPEQWSLPASSVVLRALKLAFPCKPRTH